MDDNEMNILHSKIAIEFRPIDSEKPLELKFVLMTQSPLREEDGFIKIPMDERDFFQISEVWLRYQMFKNLEFKLGSFPDSINEITPMNWPFYSLRAKMDAIANDTINWQLLVRQDIFAMYAQELNSSVATQLERTRLESLFKIIYQLERNKLLLNLNYYYEQYSDPDYTLSSLSIGRGEYIDKTITNRQQRYRIMNFSSDLTMDLQESFRVKFSFNTWKNFSADSFDRGYLLGVENSFYNKNIDISLGYWYFLGQQNSIPAASISANYYPGFEVAALHLSGRYHFSENWSAKFEYRYQHSSPYGQDVSPNLNPGNTPVIPQYKFYFIIDYAIGAS